MKDAPAPDVASLLRAHGITATPEPMQHVGYSGAEITRIVQGDSRFVLKRMSLATDLIMQLSDDTACREAAVLRSPVMPRLPPQIAVPVLGTARDGDGFAILMRDVGGALFADDGSIVSGELVLDVLAAVAAMHAAFWQDPLDDARVAWCGIAERLRLLSPAVGRRLAAEGRDFGLERGWEAFGRLAPPGAVALVRELFAEPSPLVRALEALPATLVHGDLKVANMGVDDGRIYLLDWALVMRAPAALDLSWFLVVNSSRLPWPHEEVLRRYAGHLERALGGERFAAADWPRQRALGFLFGILQMGWGKALDAEAGRPDELRWWCEGALDAARLL